MMYCIHIIIHNSNYIYPNFHVFAVLLTFLRSKLGGEQRGKEGKMKGWRGKKKGNLQYPENFFQEESNVDGSLSLTLSNF